jgi:hypothetical protein
MKKSIILIFLLIGFVFLNVNAKPKWLRLLESKDPNYFEAVKNFDKYWSKHFPPDEEEREMKHTDKENENDPRPFLIKIFQSEERAKEKSNQLSVSFKKFMKWRMEMLPYVKADGKIMSMEERLEAWKQLQKFNK